jgi:hypothetical protein
MAEGLERDAKRAGSPEHAAELRKLAQHWRSLAREAEKLDRDGPQKG